MLFLPEIRLKRVIDSLFDYLRTDLSEKINLNEENKSHLYLLFHENSDDKTSSINYNEAKTIFLRKPADPRYLRVLPILDKKRALFPTIHIVIPQDGEEYRQLGDISGSYDDENGYLRDKLGRGFQTNFNLITTSDNINEVLYINYILRALLLGSIPLLEEIGFINPHFVLQDLNVNPEIFPPNAYIKGISMSAAYPELVPEVKSGDNTINNIVFNINKIIY